MKKKRNNEPKYYIKNLAESEEFATQQDIIRGLYKPDEKVTKSELRAGIANYLVKEKGE